MPRGRATLRKSDHRGLLCQYRPRWTTPSSPSSHETLIPSRLPCVSSLENASSTPVGVCFFAMEALRRCPPRPSSSWSFSSTGGRKLSRRRSSSSVCGRSTFVSDASLHNLVAEVRAALGDAPRAARYIRTVPRYGYAFHGDARPAPAVAISRPGPSGPRLVSRHGEWLLCRRFEPGGPRSRLCRPRRFGHRLASPRPDRRDERRGHGRGSGEQERNTRERAARQATVSRSRRVTRSRSARSR